MRALTPSEARTAAIHEAGHAAVLAMEWVPCSASIVPDEETWGRVQSGVYLTREERFELRRARADGRVLRRLEERAEISGVCILAGELAVGRLARESVVGMALKTLAVQDRVTFEDLVIDTSPTGVFADRLRREWRAMAEERIGEARVWRVAMEIAGELLRSRELSEDEVAAARDKVLAELDEPHRRMLEERARLQGWAS